MKRTALVLILVLLATMCITFVACEGEGESIALSASENIYSHGEQTVQITISSLAGGDYRFEEDISVADVSVGDGLEGKEVVSVVYENSTTISVTLSGTVTGTVGKEGLLGYIAVNGGISDKAVGTAYLTVYKPQMSTSGTSSSHVRGLYSFYSTFVLPYGSFVEEYVNTGYITLPDTNGTLEVRLTDEGELYVRVKDFTLSDGVSYPTVCIAAEVTTFNKELYVFVGVPIMGQGSGYDLV